MSKVGMAFVAGLMCGLPAAAADDVAFTFGWVEGARWRVVVEWDVTLVSPAGEKTEYSGVVREMWTWDRTDDGMMLSSRQQVPVRATPRSDDVAKGIGARMAGPWQVQVGYDNMVVVDPEEMPAAFAVADLDRWTRGNPSVELGELLSSLQGKRLIPEMDHFIEQDPEDPTSPQVVQRVTQPEPCPSTGAGVDCVEVSTVVTASGAPPEGVLLPAGSKRTLTSWTIEPGNMVPHDALFRTTHGYEVASGEGDEAKTETWRAITERRLTFMAAEPPKKISR